jgi:hypothetical protein
MIEIEGLLGIVEILGVHHLMVIIAKQEVATLPNKHAATGEDPDCCASIYELQEIELIPFREVISKSPLDDAQKKPVPQGFT